MKKGNNRRRSARVAGGVAVVIAGLLSTLGSGGGGSEIQAPAAPEAPVAIKALNFNANNSESAAQLAASVMAFFPGLTALDQQVLTTLAAADPANSPFDLAMCTNTGHSLMTWIDADHSGDMSVGDSASLKFTSCDIDGSGASTSGPVKFGLTSVDSGSSLNSIGHNISVNLTVSDDPDTMVFTAAFGGVWSTQDQISFTDTFTAHDASDQVLTATRNGDALFQFGCFRVTQKFSAADGAGTYKLLPSGVVNASDTIMSLADGTQLSFVGNIMESGTKRLLSSPAAHCAILGIPNGVEDSDGSYIDMEAVGGGAVRLHTFDTSNVEFYTTDTGWDALLN